MLISLTSCNIGAKTDENKRIGNLSARNVLSVKKRVFLKDECLTLIYEQYEMLSNTLVKNDFVAAKECVLLLLMVAKQNLANENLVKISEQMLNTSNISELRASFSRFSNQLISEIKKAKLENGVLYLQYCPMALGDKGASWISSNEQILNPYFGAEMLNCGEVIETLK